MIAPRFGLYSLPEFLLRAAVVAASCWLYYRVVLPDFNNLAAPRVIHFFRLDRRYAYLDIDGVVRLALSGVSQAIFCVVLVMITQIDVPSLIVDNFQPVLVIYGVMLGLGETALVAWFGHLSMRLAGGLRPAAGPMQTSDWLVVVKGGWMRQYMSTVELLPLPLALLNMLPYICGEEIVFRGILLNYFLPFGAGLALAIALLFFVMAQVIHMPSWQSAMLPVVGALTIGILHCLLLLAVPNIIPLVIAHLVFFVTSVM